MKIAIAGNPNCGKTSLFNIIAGTNYQVANYPGITVEKKTANISYKNQNLQFIDLPGTYSLTAYSLEEVVARNFIIEEKPDLVVHVVDASNIERNLYLTIQFLELNVPVVIALNMMDMAQKRGISIDTEKLSNNLGIPVVPTIARKGEGKEALLDMILGHTRSEKSISDHFTYGEDIDNAMLEMKEIITGSHSLSAYPYKWIALKYLENDEEVFKVGIKDEQTHNKLIAIAKKVEKHTDTTLETYPEAIIADYRYGIVSSVLKDVVKRSASSIDRVFLSDKIDSVLTHKLLGPIIMLTVLYLAYQFTFWASTYPVEWMEGFFGLVSDLVDKILPNGLFKSLIISGIIDGVGGVLGFTPLILFMFFFIAILEDSGYMTRIAYMLDKIFRCFGMQGSSVLPYIVSGGIAGGCAVPGVMAARTIKGKRERLLTILTSPFMPCGAKLPIYVLLIAAFFPTNQGLAMMGITLFSWLVALIGAKIISLTMVRDEPSSFVMELPPYRFPTLKGLTLHAWERTWMYIKKAGTIILALSIVIWAAMTFPGLSEDRERAYKVKMSQATTQEQQLAIENEQASEALENSVAGQVGRWMEPISILAGFDWRTNIALLGGIAAKEVIVSTLGTAYSLGEVDPEDSTTLSQKLATKWPTSTAVALLIFVIFYAPCFVTVIVIARETASYSWAGFTLIAYSIVAVLLAIVANQLLGG